MTKKRIDSGSCDSLNQRRLPKMKNKRSSESRMMVAVHGAEFTHSCFLSLFLLHLLCHCASICSVCKHSLQMSLPTVKSAAATSAALWLYCPSRVKYWQWLCASVSGWSQRVLFTVLREVLKVSWQKTYNNTAVTRPDECQLFSLQYEPRP